MPESVRVRPRRHGFAPHMHLVFLREVVVLVDSSAQSHKTCHSNYYLPTRAHRKPGGRLRQQPLQAALDIFLAAVKRHDDRDVRRLSSLLSRHATTLQSAPEPTF